MSKYDKCKFPLTGCLQKICHFFCKTCAISFLMSKAYQKAKFYKNLTCESGSKQRFSLLQEKAVIHWGLRQLVLKPGFRPKGIEGFGFVGKVRKFQQPQTNTFELCKKKLKGGQIAPPPAGIGLNTKKRTVPSVC